MIESLSTSTLQLLETVGLRPAARMFLKVTKDFFRNLSDYEDLTQRRQVAKTQRFTSVVMLIMPVVQILDHFEFHYAPFISEERADSKI